MDLAFVPPLRRTLHSERVPHALLASLAGAVEETARSMLDPASILALAEDMGVVRRVRVHHPGLVIDSLILSALQRSTDTQGRWLDAQRAYEALGGDQTKRRCRPLFPPEPPAHETRRPPTIRTFFAVGLQLGRAFPMLLNLVRSIESGDRPLCRRATLAIASAILDGARDRGRGKYVPTVVDQQRRDQSLTRLRPSRPGRTPQAVARRQGAKVAA